LTSQPQLLGDNVPQKIEVELVRFGRGQVFGEITPVISEVEGQDKHYSCNKEKKGKNFDSASFK